MTDYEGYGGPERRIENRITMLEAHVEQVKDLRLEMIQFRHDLFALLNPMRDDIASHKEAFNNWDKKNIPQRISNLEHARTFLAGAWAVLGFLLYALWDSVRSKLNG